MSTQSPLPPGAFFTTINGRKCSAIPKSTAASSAAAAESTAKNTNVGNAGADTNLATSTTSSSLVIVIRTSSSSTSTSTSTSTTSIAQTTIAQALNPPALVPNPAVEATQAAPAVVTPPAAVTTSSSTVGRESTSTTSSFEAPSQTSQSQEAQASSGVKSSETDNSQTAPAANAGTALPDVTPSPVLSDPAGASPLFTTIGTAAPSSDNAAAAATDTSGSTNSAVSAIPNPNSNAVQSTVAVAGGVIGGVVALSLIAFLLWWWRRRAIKRRRSTLLTPLTTTASFARDEKGAYVINRGSIGPTPMSEKIRAALDYNMKKIRSRMSALVTRSGASSPSINMNRGNSQFMEPVSTHSRVNSSATIVGAELTTKDRFKDWLSRLTADMNFNWRMRNNMSNSTEAMSAAAVGTREKKGVVGSQPDFLTLLGMDEGELDREAQRRRASFSRKKGSSASAEHFLGGLNLNFSSEDPFSDENALAHRSAKPAPLIVSQPNNPFSDENAIRNPAPTVPKPTTYVADIRRSRGQSVTGTRPPSTVYRESVASVESFQTRRNKFRSDPFDLERPELLAGARQAQNSISSSLAGTTGSSLPRDSRIPSKPAGAHTRSESFTSKYSSGVSMGDWSDPGPDVGPGSGPRWDGPEARESPTQGWRDRQEREAAQHARGGGRESGGSQGSVGKAM
ncbi:hypothetical protein GQ53DRAFT_750265 [Thozetella sp. PMI_491]|nr:hypothetical protein GQ53DRAFT_750265 [Thozetella sp. PMI_491]